MLSRAAFCISALAFNLAIAATAQAQNWNGAKSGQVQMGMNQLVATHTPSVAVGVSINGTVVFTGGAGTTPSGPPTAQTVYHIGSLTKQFTAAAILTLAEGGAIAPFNNQPFSIDAPVSNFFENVNHWGPLTVRELLTMTSGLPSYTSLQPPLGVNPSVGAPWLGILQLIKTYPRMSSPGFSYSNTNYFLLAEIVEVLTSSGNNWGDYQNYIRTQLFARANMTRSGFVENYAPGTSRAPPYYRQPALFGLPDWPKGAGNIASTVEDMLKWDQALLSGSVVSPAVLNQMWAPAIPAYEGASYGIGWLVRNYAGIQHFYHEGAIPGYSAFNRITRRGNGSTVAVVALANSDAVPLKTFTEQIVMLADAP